MLRLTEPFSHIRGLANRTEAQGRVSLARLVVAVLALIGLEVLLVIWLYGLQAGRPALQPVPYVGPSLILTHPKGPLSLFLVLLGVAIATICRDIAELTRNDAAQVKVRLVKIRQSVSHAYVLAGFAVAVALIARWGD